jgi:multimeric flavodoxin WrbA
MRVLGLVGSPRKGGNTDIMVDAVLERARGNGHETEKVYLYEESIGPCIDCRGCKKGDLVCIVEDGMQKIYPKLDSANAIVFGTPVYWVGPSGTMKQLFDRLRPYFGNGRIKGKKAILVAPAGDGPSEADLLTEMFRRSFEYLKIEFLGYALGKAYDRKEILNDKQAMDRAAELGASL